MKSIFLVLIFILSFPMVGFGQNDFDYVLINKIIDYEQETYGRDSVSFLTYYNYKSKTFNRKERKNKDILQWYTYALEGLFKDTLQSYQSVITANKVKKIFIKWDKRKLHFPRIVEEENGNFFYHTQSLIIAEELFVTLNISDCEGGGVSAALWKFDKSKGSIVPIKYYTISRYEIRWR